MRGFIIGAGLVVGMTVLTSGWMAVPVAAMEEGVPEDFDCAEVGHLWEDADKVELVDASRHFRSTRLYFSQKLFRKAAREAEIAIKLDLTEAKFFMRGGMAYAELGCYIAAGNAFATALRMVEGIEKEEKLVTNIKNNRAHYWTYRFNEAIGLLEEDDLDGAAREFSNAISIDSTDVRAYRNLGVVYLRLKENHQALATFTEALALDPSDEQTRYNFRRTTNAIAVDEFNLGLNLAGLPDSLDRGKSMITGAIGMLEDAISWEPPNSERVEYEVNLGTCNQALGQVEPDSAASRAGYFQAITHYRKAAVLRQAVLEEEGKLAPGINADTDYLRPLLSCFLATSEYDSVLVYGRMMVDMNPKEPIGYNYMAEAFRGKGEQEKALVYLLMRQSLEKGVEVPNINDHFIGLITVYQPGDDIIKATMSMESPEEIRVNRESDNIYEAWIFWAKGYADCYYNGRHVGKAEFEPAEIVE